MHKMQDGHSRLLVFQARMVPHTQGLAAQAQTSDAAAEIAAMQAAVLTQVHHRHLETMKQLERREARMRDEKLLLSERTRVLAKREQMQARTLCSFNMPCSIWVRFDAQVMYLLYHEIFCSSSKIFHEGEACAV